MNSYYFKGIIHYFIILYKYNYYQLNLFIQVLLEFKIKFSDTVRKLLGSTGWLMGDKVIRMLVGLYVTVWMVRYLGPEQLGLLNLATAVVAIFSLLSTLGLEQIVIKEITQSEAEQNKILGSALFLRLAGSALCILFSLLTMIIIRPGNQTALMLAFLVSAGIGVQSFELIDYYFRAIIKVKYSVLPRIIVFVLVNLYRVYLITTEAPLVYFGFALFLEMAVGILSIIISYHVTGKSIFKWNIDREKYKSLIKQAWPIIIASISVILYMRIDQVMLAQLKGDKPVGLYSAAIKLTEYLYFIPMAIISITYPLLIKYYDINKEKYRINLQNLHNLLTLGGIAIAVPTSLLSGFMISVIYGEAFAPSSLVLGIHIWCLVFVGWSLIKESVLVIEGKQMYTMYSTTIGAVLNIILNFILIPPFDITGAAVATLISYAGSSTISIYLFPATRHLVSYQYRSLFRFYDIKLYQD